MASPEVQNQNDFKVVTFTNLEGFDFTPDMGCMYDSRPILGRSGAPGIQSGESVVLPYHVGNRLAINLAKVSMTRKAPAIDAAGIPTGVPLWDQVQLDRITASFLKDLYTESNPLQQSETDRLMAKVEEYGRMVQQLLDEKNATNVPVAIVNAPEFAPKVVDVPSGDSVDPDTVTGTEAQPLVAPEPKKYQDKQDVIAELEKRQIKHDKRKSMADLEKLLV